MTDPDRPLFEEDSRSSADSGNRCRLYIHHVLFLILIRIRGNPTQGQIGAQFDVDQSIVSRYLQFAKEILRDMLPTAKRIAAVIRKTPPEDIEQIILEKKLIIDDIITPVTRPADKEQRKKMYSGKKKKFGYNTLITTTMEDLIIDMSKTVAGNTHDFTLLKNYDLDFGIHTAQMKESVPTDPLEKSFIIYSDLGFLGIQKEYPGVISRQPDKKPKGKKLTEE